MPASSLRTASFYFGIGSTSQNLKAVAGDVISVLIALAALTTAAAYYYVKYDATSTELTAVLLDVLFDLLIPGLAGVSFLVSLVLSFRALTRTACTTIDGVPSPGRKATLSTTSAALLFAGSTFYRSLNIASEGAALCREQPSMFNAPIAGRTVATVGEIALVIQASLFIEEASTRLHTQRGFWAPFCTKWTHVHFSTVVPVLLAEVCSWSGVLQLAGDDSGLFFCVEYVLWMVIAATWAWDR